MKAVLLFVILFSAVTLAQKLVVGGTKIWYQGQPVFLNGINQAWVDYGRDFGNGNSARVWGEQMHHLDRLKGSGGNSIRYWLFVEGKEIPEWTGNGFTVGPDREGNLIRDCRNYVREAQKRGIAVIFVLWNGALMGNDHVKNLFWDDQKLQSFIDKALVPLVVALKDEPGLAAWEIINEPEALVSNAGDGNPCFDGSKIAGNGAGWVGVNIPMRNILRFINWQADAIKRNDANTMVTVGSWAEKANTDMYGYVNYFKDSCLRAAGGRDRGVLDFYQIHCYSYNGQFSDKAPFRTNAWDYNLDKPVILGEYAEDLGDGHGGGGMAAWQLAKYTVEHGYQGAWGWADQGNNKDLFFQRMYNGVGAIRDKSTPLYGVDNRFPTTPSGCQDIPPGSDFTCEQQKNFGACSQPWMNGYCKISCGTCGGGGGGGCDDVPPPGNSFTCEEQKGFGACVQPWMKGYCKRSCFNCNSQAIGDNETVIPYPTTPIYKETPSGSLSSVAIGIIVAGVVVGVLMILFNSVILFRAN